ncbi:MAG TPA: DUF177 domain-containing protein [Paludibacter sp.]|jgi:uncharacterized metal-binding protein YceD (DUF177 family)|nr:MAG: hypothetical protein BWY08_00614 [Bacteroidetes bacterium ADurb.Bin174]HQB27889.1 DUF177 domain-containing protein [Paludibacter sp.]
MSKFGQYNINLKEIADKVQIFKYDLNDDFFDKIDSVEVKKGSVQANVHVQKRISTYELTFKLDGFIKLPCDRCLDDMDQYIKHEEIIQVKFGNEFAEENDTVIVPEAEGSINIAWFLYEFIILNIPIKHVHAPGECNKNMIDKLRRHMIRHKDDTEDSVLFEEEGDDDSDDFENDSIVEETQIDPRWESLQQINFENN